ncbi:MAG: class E sortase [Acidimicrobiales bacterium]
MPVARIVGAIGRTLITVGILLLLFVAYQLWGTGLAEARAQSDLRADFEASLEAALTSTTTSTSTTRPARRATTTEPTAPPTTVAAVPEGEAIAIIRIPRIGVDKAVVEGVSVDALKKGPGHYPGTPLPGEPGNAAIAGHRTTYGAPFGDLGELQEGDEILVTTREGEFRYLVDRISIVSPSQVDVLDPSEEAKITLTTCHPKYSARERLIVTGVLAGDPISAPPTTEPDEPAPEEPAEPEEPDAPEEEGTEDDPVLIESPPSLDDPSLAGDPSARGPAAAWGGATALIALAAWFVGARWRRWPSYLLGLPFGAVTLFLCFEQIARLLPSNI